MHICQCFFAEINQRGTLLELFALHNGLNCITVSKTWNACPLCLHFHFCIKHFTGLMWPPNWCWRWKSLGVMGRRNFKWSSHCTHFVMHYWDRKSVSQSYQISYPKVATLVSPPLLHNCQSARFVSLWMLQLRRQLAGERDKNVQFPSYHFLFDNLLLSLRPG